MLLSCQAEGRVRQRVLQNEDLTWTSVILVSSWRWNSINDVLCLSANRYRTDFCTAWGKSVRWCPWTVGMYSVQHCHDFKVTIFLIVRYSPCVCLLTALHTQNCVSCCWKHSPLADVCKTLKGCVPYVWIFLASLLTSRNEVREKLSAASLVQFRAFYRTWNSVTVFQFLSHAMCTHSVPSNPMSLRLIWIQFLLSHGRQCLAAGPFPSGYLAKILYAFSFSHACCISRPSCYFFFFFLTVLAHSSVRSSLTCQ